MSLTLDPQNAPETSDSFLTDTKFMETQEICKATAYTVGDERRALSLQVQSISSLQWGTSGACPQRGGVATVKRTHICIQALFGLGSTGLDASQDWVEVAPPCPDFATHRNSQAQMLSVVPDFSPSPGAVPSTPPRVCDVRTRAQPIILSMSWHSAVVHRFSGVACNTKNSVQSLSPPTQLQVKFYHKGRGV